MVAVGGGGCCEIDSDLVETDRLVTLSGGACGSFGGGFDFLDLLVSTTSLRL